MNIFPPFPWKLPTFLPYYGPHPESSNVCSYERYAGLCAAFEERKAEIESNTRTSRPRRRVRVATEPLVHHTLFCLICDCWVPMISNFDSRRRRLTNALSLGNFGDVEWRIWPYDFIPNPNYSFVWLAHRHRCRRRSTKRWPKLNPPKRRVCYEGQT